MIDRPIAVVTSLVAVLGADPVPADTVPCRGGTAGIYPCNNVDLLAFVPHESIGGGNGNDVWGWTDSRTGKEYAIVGRTNGTSFVDVSDPENPVYLGNLPPHTSNSTWRDIRTHADHVFIVSEAGGHGMQIFDLTQLRDISRPQTFTSTAHYAGIGHAHNLFINETTGFAYIVGSDACFGGPHMVDVSNPAEPVFVGCFSNDGYTANAEVVIYNGPDTSYIGSEIAFCANEDTLTIADVTNKAASFQVARVPYPGSEYANHVAVTEDHLFAIMADELDEVLQGGATRTHIWSIFDLDDPQYLGFSIGTTNAIDHENQPLDDVVFQTAYRGGLRILDASDPGPNLPELGFFDTYPANDDPNYSGAWGAYVQFNSGIVLVNNIESGLFVLRPTLGCAADLDGDGVVDINDLLAVLAGWGTPAGDVNGDGTTDVDDLLAMLTTFGPC